MIIRPIVPSDLDSWLPLWEGYNTFYKRTIPQEVTRTSWDRFLNPSEPMFALVAESEAGLVGFVHYLFHRNTGTLNDVCYLQDLFTLPGYRGQGIGRALIEAVYQKAGTQGAPRVYWQTHETNVAAMKLYDKVAERSGFLVYRKSLQNK